MNLDDGAHLGQPINSKITPAMKVATCSPAMPYFAGNASKDDDNAQ